MLIVAFHEDLCNFLFFSIKTINKKLSAAVYGRVGCITFHYMQFGRALGIPISTANTSKHFRSQQYGTAECIPFQQRQYGRAGNIPFFKCRNVGLSGIQSVRYRNEQKCRCRNKSGTEIRGPSPVPDWNTGCRNADAGGIDLDADAQLRTTHILTCESMSFLKVLSTEKKEALDACAEGEHQYQVSNICLFSTSSHAATLTNKRPVL